MARAPWQPPWPPIRVGVDEWVVMRNSMREPAAVIRALELGARGRRYFRVVTWAQTSTHRTLVGYFETLEQADQSVLFDQPTATTPAGDRGAAYPDYAPAETTGTGAADPAP